jgi:metal-sulfur cluster biosynthetic enzyme
MHSLLEQDGVKIEMLLQPSACTPTRFIKGKYENIIKQIIRFSTPK